MKRVFVVLSNIVVSFFFVWVLNIWSDSYVSYVYPSVSVFDSSTEVSFDRVSASLSRLAEETDSFLAIQHQEIGLDGVPVFSYTTFGQGELPEGLSEKSLEESKDSSVETNYFVFEGRLEASTLRQELSTIGLENLYVTIPSNLGVLTSVFSGGFQGIGILIFFLTFGTLSLISQIRTLRTVGIRLISGENRWKAFLSPLAQDVGNSLLGLVVSLVLVTIVRPLIFFPSVSFRIVGTGLIVYNLILLTISLFFACIFAIGIKKIHLMQVIKGQIPVNGVISLILIGQLLAMTIVSIGIHRTLLYSQAWQQQEQGHESWYKENELAVLTVGRSGVAPGFDAEAIKKQQTWFNLIKQAVSEQKVFLSRHYLAEQGLIHGNISSSSLQEDYSPQGNVLIVTPKYLKRQHVAVESDIENQMNQLAVGEFILLLPEHLKLEESYYKSLFEENITNLMSSHDTRQDMVATVSYLEAGYHRFIYNTTPISYQQFLRDPIIIVLTPQSTGEQSFTFWEQMLHAYLFFDNLETAQAIIAAHGLETWVGELQSGYQVHQNILNKIQREVLAMVMGAVLGSVTSMLMFYTMNSLYFEEFRRDIFIKRISGLRFLEIHRTYLLAQLFIFSLGFLISMFLSVNMLLAFMVLLLFIGLSILQLHIQMKKENKTAMLILKGA